MMIYVGEWHNKFLLIPILTADHGLLWLKWVWVRKLTRRNPRKLSGYSQWWDASFYEPEYKKGYNAEYYWDGCSWQPSETSEDNIIPFPPRSS